MASFNQYSGDGVTTNFNITFPYLDGDHVEAFVDASPVTFTFNTPSVVVISPAPASGTGNVVISRNTPLTPIVDFVNGSTLSESDLDTATLQAIYIAEEAADSVGNTIVLDAYGVTFTAGGRRISNLGTPTDAADATTKAYVDSVSGAASADAAAASAAAALVSENNAAQSASDAAASAATFAFASQAEVDAGTVTDKSIAPDALSGYADLSKNVLTTQGDLLYRDGSGLARLAPGTSGQVLTTNGAASNPTWQDTASGITGAIRVFSANGSYTPTAGATYVLIEAVGGGGGYGSLSCRGGGGGGYGRRMMAVSDLTTPVTVTIGGGGASGTGGAPGTVTSFGTYVTANGGAGGVSGTGGTATGGDLNITGQGGTGTGGATPLGFPSTSAGINGTGFGAGSSNTIDWGSSGGVVITEF